MSYRTSTNRKGVVSFIAAWIVVIFTFTTVIPPQAYAQNITTVLNLPVPGSMVLPSDSYLPTVVKGLQINPDNPLNFTFYVSQGNDTLQGDALQEEAEKLIKYFLATLTVPSDELWVNLSPYEKEDMIPQIFGQTEMGRDLLAQDYLLKQLTASLMYPEDALGERYWKSLRDKVVQKFGTSDMAIDAFHKVWIVPDQATVYEHEGRAFVVNSRLKVMLSEDYTAMQKEAGRLSQENGEQVTSSTGEITSQAIRNFIIPEIEKEVNHGETFANLRQIYHSMILAAWFKNNLKESLLGQIYNNQGKVSGVDVDDPQVKNKIYQQYLDAFSKGVYNYIREDLDPESGEMIPRKYFSGGAGFAPVMRLVDQNTITAKTADPAMLLRVAEASESVDLAMNVDLKTVEEADRAMFFGSKKEAAVGYFKDQLEQQKNQSGLEGSLPDVSKSRRDILLATTQFLEVMSYSKTGEVTFSGREARRELVENPDISRLMLDYLDQKTPKAEEDVKKALQWPRDVSWLDILFENGIKKINSTNADIVERTGEDAIAINFSVSQSNVVDLRQEMVFIYSPGRFLSLTQIVDTGETAKAEGGLRYVVAEEKGPQGAMVPSEVGTYEAIGEAYQEVNMLARAKYYRNAVTETAFAGGKTLMIVNPDAVNMKRENLRAWSRAAVDIGLPAKYTLGFESGMTVADQEFIATTIFLRYSQHLRNELNQIKKQEGVEDLTFLQDDFESYAATLKVVERADNQNKAFLSDPLINALRDRIVERIDLGKQKGGTSTLKLFSSEIVKDLQKIIGAAAVRGLTRRATADLEESAFPAKSATHGIETIFKYLHENNEGLPPLDRKIAIKGGTLGAILALNLIRLGYTIVAIKDVNGGVYKKEGFTIEDLLRLVKIKKSGKNVLEWMPESDEVDHFDSENSLYVEGKVDAMMNASPEKLTNKDVHYMSNFNSYSDKPLVYIDVGYNSFEGLEDVLNKNNVLAFKATSFGLGKAYSANLEDLIHHRFAAEDLRRTILGAVDRVISTGEDTVVTEKVYVYPANGSPVAFGDITVRNGKVVASNVAAIPVNTAIATVRTYEKDEQGKEVSKFALHNYGFDVGYEVESITQSIVWENYRIDINQKNRVIKSNHHLFPVGTYAHYVDPITELRQMTYQNIEHLSQKLNIMIMELVLKHGMTPSEAVFKIAHIISAKKKFYRKTVNKSIRSQINQIIDELENQNFLFEPGTAADIAISRLTAVSPLQINIDGQVHVFTPEGKMQPLGEDGLTQEKLDAITAEYLQKVEAGLNQPWIQLLEVNLYKDKTQETKGEADSTVKEDVFKASEEAIRYIQDQRQQKMNRSGLNDVLPDMKESRRDILLATTEFLEIYTEYEGQSGKDVFDAQGARRDLVQYPQVAKLMIEYLYEGAAEDVEGEIAAIDDQEAQSRLSTLFERGIRNINKTSADIVLPYVERPIAISFDGTKVTGVEMRKELIFIYSPGRFFAMTQLVDEGNADHTKGGIRWAQAPGKTKQEEFENAFKRRRGAYDEINNLSTSQYFKNVLAGLGYAGGKTFFAVHPDAVSIKDKLLRRWANAMIDIGLMPKYDGGPDVGMSPANQETIIEAIVKRYSEHLKSELSLIEKYMHQQSLSLEELNFDTYQSILQKIEAQNPSGDKFLSDELITMMRRVLFNYLDSSRTNNSIVLDTLFSGAYIDQITKIIGSGVTGGSALVGALSHIQLAVTGFGVFKTSPVVIEKYLSKKPQDIRVAVVGAGDVGGSSALYFARAGYKVVAISDFYGVVYKDEGFTIEELQQLNTIDTGLRNVTQWMPEGDGVVHFHRDEVLDADKVKDIQLLVPAAMGKFINPGNIDKLKDRDIIIIEGSNNAFVGMDHELQQMGILATDGSSNNPGGVIASTTEVILKHRRTIKELREVVLEYNGQVIPTGTENTVYERIEIIKEGKKLGLLHVYNGILVMVDLYEEEKLDEFVVGMDIDVMDGKILNRGYNLGYEARWIERTVEWDSFYVVLDQDGNVIDSNHPAMDQDVSENASKQFLFKDPLDGVKEKLYQTIENTITQNLTMIMELESKGFDITPTQAAVKIAESRGKRKFAIYQATEGSDAEARNAVMKRFEEEGYLMIEPIARNIASMEVAMESRIVIEVGDQQVTFGEDGTIQSVSQIDAEDEASQPVQEAEKVINEAKLEQDDEADDAMLDYDPVKAIEKIEKPDEVGGIDLNPDLLDIKIKRDGRGIPLPMPQQSIEALESIKGFVPVIINWTPVINMPLLLGLHTEEEDGDANYSLLTDRPKARFEADSAYEQIGYLN